MQHRPCRHPKRQIIAGQKARTMALPKCQLQRPVVHYNASRNLKPLHTKSLQHTHHCWMLQRTQLGFGWLKLGRLLYRLSV
jgi:hypothetical protein